MDELKPGETIAATGLVLTVLGILGRWIWSVVNLFRQVKDNTAAIEQMKSEAKEQHEQVRADIKDVSKQNEKRDEAIFTELRAIRGWLVEGKGR